MPLSTAPKARATAQEAVAVVVCFASARQGARRADPPRSRCHSQHLARRVPKSAHEALPRAEIRPRELRLAAAAAAIAHTARVASDVPPGQTPPPPMMMTLRASTDPPRRRRRCDVVLATGRALRFESDDLRRPSISRVEAGRTHPHLLPVVVVARVRAEARANTPP